MPHETLLGFDIGGTKCGVHLGNAAGEPFANTQFPTPTGFPATWDALRAAASRLTREHAVAEAGIAAVGFSCGGPLDAGRGIVQSPPNLPGWDDIPIVRIARDAYGVPSFLMNDANACALAEWRFGAGQGSRNMVFITMGTGFGAGLILDGRLYEGTCGMAGEVGHMRLAPEGHAAYGKNGSWEAFCGGNGIAEYARLRALDPAWREVASVYTAGANDGDFSVRNLRAAADRGDAFACRVFADVGDNLGRGLAILLDLLNPDRIVIGSIFERCEAHLRPTMERALAAEALPQCVAACRVVPAALGDRIGAYAALLVARHGLDERPGG